LSRGQWQAYQSKYAGDQDSLRTEGCESHRQLPSMLGEPMTQYTVKKTF
jgi:hypothetical protein